MDQLLKQRLIGVTIAVALVVIFVPMLFEKSDDKGKISNAGIPSIPDEVMEKPLELPKTAEDLAPKETEEGKGQDKKPSAPTGYVMAPFNEEAQPKPKPPAPAAAKPVVEESDDEAPVDAENGVAPSVKKTVVEPQDAPAVPVKPLPAKMLKPTPTEAVLKKPTEPKVQKPKAAPVTVKAPLAAPAAEAAQAPDAGEGVAPKKEPLSSPAPKPKPPVAAPKKAPPTKPPVAKSAEASPVVIKTVKVNKPKPVAPPPDIDGEEEEPISPAVPAKAAAPKPKPQAAVTHRSAETAPKKHEAPKSAETPRPSVKSENPDSEPPARPQPAKSAAPKPAATPAKPAPTVVKKPSTWVIQAGSFTDETAARTFADKLKQSKIPATVQAVHGEHGSTYKVQVGADRDRGHAEETLKQIQGSTGVNGTLTERH